MKRSPFTIRYIIAVCFKLGAKIRIKASGSVEM